MDNKQIAKEIVITMIQNDKIHPTSKRDFEDLNRSYTEEVCKAFIAVYKTVNNAAKSIYDDE